MKSIVKRAIREEEGKMMIMVLVLLVVGGLVLAPLLGLMSTGLMAGQVYEKKAVELYAADAGIEDAIWRVRNNLLEFDSYNYSHLDLLTVNDRTVEVVVYRENIGTGCHKEFRYQILSSAAGGDGSTTTVEAYIDVLHIDFSSLLDYAVVSQKIIDFQSKVLVDGDVWLTDQKDLSMSSGSVVDGDIVDSTTVPLVFPTYADLSGYYWPDVQEGAEIFSAARDTINLSSAEHTQDFPRVLGPLISNGNMLTIKGTGWAKLGGTVFVETGDLRFNPTNWINLNLNGQTIFVNGDLTMGGGVTLSGSGCIIARGDINFGPQMASAESDFVLVMSIEGTVDFSPKGRFTGSIVGNKKVQLSPDSMDDFFIRWIPWEGRDLNYPMGDAEFDGKLPVGKLAIVSWQIK